MDRLRKRAEFLAVAKGPRANRRAFTLQAAKPEAVPAPDALAPEAKVAAARIGFTVTKREGTAVERNRIRRRLRAAIDRINADVVRPGLDYVLVGRRDALHTGFAALVEELHGAFLHVHKAPATPARPRSRGQTDRPRQDR